MDKRKSQLNSRKICRFCLSQDVSILTSLYEKSRSSKKGVNLHFQILKCMGVEVFPSDGLPSYICDYCRFFMEISYDYKQMCRTADENVLHHLQKGEALKPLTYPGNLIKLFHSIHQSTAKDTQTIVTEEGAFVQVTSQDHTESDEDGDVYNIKISKNPADGKETATIKMITDKDVTKIDKPNKSDAVIDVSGISTSSSPEAQIIYHQCNQVIGTGEEYEEEHLDEHMDEEFTNKCNICDKTLKNESMLKRHKKRMHPELNANNSEEQINVLAEEKLVIKQIDTQCGVCNDKFKTVQSLRQHVKQMHGQYKYACVLCPERFESMQNLTKHALKHTDGTCKQCKYCDKVFDETAQYNKHIRKCHSANESCEQIDDDDDDDPFHCEECDETFTTQDDLIYHSALHATQNLTCPLCQEKFENVDAVTAHIKSHVDGAQFMCDLCELVFVSNEKCQAHLREKHADEQAILATENEDESKEEDDNMSVTDEGDHMVVQLKKPDDFIMTTSEIPQLSAIPSGFSINTQHGSKKEATPTTVVNAVRNPPSSTQKAAADQTSIPKPKSPITEVKLNSKVELQLPQREASEVAAVTEVLKVDKPKSTTQITVAAASEKTAERPESTPTQGASDKSLKLLEKELQELKRTSVRNGNADKTPLRSDTRGRRSLVATSTPKSKSSLETKKLSNQYGNEKRRIAATKENSEPKETKESKNNNSNIKENKEEKEKEKENKSATVEKVVAEEGVRRSRRSSKVKDYAKMAFSISSDEGSDEEFQNLEPDTRARGRKNVGKPTRAPTPTPEPEVDKLPAAVPATPNTRKRGRPRKEATTPKVAKLNTSEPLDELTPSPKKDTDDSQKENGVDTSSQEPNNSSSSVDKSQSTETPSTSTFKPSDATPSTSYSNPEPSTSKSENVPKSNGTMTIDRMQLGTKSVKVKKILMTKAQVAKMVADGLVEILNGHVVVKHGIKIPELSDATSTEAASSEPASSEASSNEAETKK